MNIVIFGATGGVGRELVSQGVAGGHSVTAFVRNPAALPARDRLRVVVGDALDGDAVASAIAGQDAVLSALGSRKLSDAELLPRSMDHILISMGRSGVRRLIVLGAAGALEDANRRLSTTRKLLFDVMKATLLRKPFESQAAMQRLVRASARDWTIVLPPRLLDSPATGKYRVDGKALPADAGSIPRADLAAFMLAQLGSTEWVRRSPYIAS